MAFLGWGTEAASTWTPRSSWRWRGERGGSLAAHAHRQYLEKEGAEIRRKKGGFCLLTLQAAHVP